MDEQQKSAILTLLKACETNRDYAAEYWVAYKDFLDPAEEFADFACEHLDGKSGYIALIEKLLGMDETAKIFVQVYGFEEDNNEQFIYADTLIIFSKLPFAGIKRIFNEPTDIFPSDIGEIKDFSQPAFLVGAQGELTPGAELINGNHFAYYCWWD